MTGAELLALRESIIRQMAQPQSISMRDRSVSNRALQDLEKALARVELEIAVLNGTSAIRCTLASFSKG